MSTRDELLDSLTAERYRPIPTHVPPERSGDADSPATRQRRRAALFAETAPKRSPQDAAEAVSDSERDRLRRLMPGRTPKETPR